jgi:hypothetical protein
MPPDSIVLQRDRRDPCYRIHREVPASKEQVRVSELEAEVGRLKLLVAELALDRRMLQEALKKKP